MWDAERPRWNAHVEVTAPDGTRRELLNQVRPFFRNISPGGSNSTAHLLGFFCCYTKERAQLMAVHRRKIGGFVPCQSTPLNL